ncbi:MAG: hypothetical protein C0501_01105 [Isosphaera sp.]|nr:hypothetical protein [Isosphaera sp.]
MPVEVSCPGCGLKLKAPDAMTGKKAKCKKCATSFRVPGAAAAGDSNGDEPLLSAMALPSPFDFDAPPAARDVGSLPSADPFDFDAPAARPAPPPPAPKPAPAPPKPAASPKPAPPPPGSRPAFGAARAAAAVAPPAAPPEPTPAPKATPAPARPSAAKPKPAPAPDPAPLEAELLPLDDEEDAAPDTDTRPAKAADPFAFGGPADVRAEPRGRRDRDEDDEDDRPRSRRRDDRYDEDDRPRGRDRDRRRDDEDRDREAPRYRKGAEKSGNAMRYAVILGVLAVGAAVAAVVVYVKAKREEEQARLKAEEEKRKKEEPPPEPPKDDGKGKVDPKGKEKEPPKKDKEPKEPAKKEPAAPAFAIPAAAKPLTVNPLAPPGGGVLQTPGDPKVAVEAPADKVRQVFPSDGGDRDTVVVWVSNPGTGGKGQRVAVDTYDPKTGAKGKGFEFDGDGSAAVKCDVSPDGKQFVAAGPDGKVTVWGLADGAKVVDGFDPYGELGPDGKRHKDDGLAAVYFTKTPGHLLTVTSAGVVHLFDPAAPKGERKKQATGPSGVLTAGKVTRGRNVAADESRSVLVLAAYGAVYRYDTATLRELPGKITLGGEVTRPLALGVSAGSPGHLAFLFETDANGRKEKGLMLVNGKGDPAKPAPEFYRWADAAGEAAAVDWAGDRLAVVATTKGVVWVEFEPEAKRLYPFAFAGVPDGKAVHAATERHWYLVPDPTRPGGSLLLPLAWPPGETLDIRQDALAGSALHVLKLDEKGLSR